MPCRSLLVASWHVCLGPGFFEMIWYYRRFTLKVQSDSNFNQKAGIIMRYKIVLQKSEEGYSVSCPGLPGCWSQGATEAEALDNIQDAIREYLAAVDDLLRETPEAEVREVEVVV